MARARKNNSRPRPDRPTTLAIPPVDHLNVRDLIDSIGGPAEAATTLRVSEDLMRMWHAGEIDTPFTAQLALWWHSPWGFDQAFCESHWTHQYNTFLKREARDRVELLEAFILAQGLNPPAGRITTHQEMLLAGPQHPDSTALRQWASRPSALPSSRPSKQLDQP